MLLDDCLCPLIWITLRWIRLGKCTRDQVAPVLQQLHGQMLMHETTSAHLAVEHPLVTHGLGT